MNPYIESLYRTRTPAAAAPEEFFELSLGEQTVDGQLSYYVRATQCWWDPRAKRTVRVQYTLSPREGLTIEKAYQLFQLQRIDRARRGYVHSFTPCYESSRNNKYVRIEVPPQATNPEIQPSEVPSQP